MNYTSDISCSTSRSHRAPAVAHIIWAQSRSKKADSAFVIIDHNFYACQPKIHPFSPCSGLQQGKYHILRYLSERITIFSRSIPSSDGISRLSFPDFPPLRPAAGTLGRLFLYFRCVPVVKSGDLCYTKYCIFILFFCRLFPKKAALKPRFFTYEFCQRNLAEHHPCPTGEFHRYRL